MATRKKILASVMGGQILLVKGGLIRHWKFVLYLFFLVIMYISVHFWMKGTIIAMDANQETIKNLKTVYTGKYSKLLDLSKRGEVERMLKEKGSTLSGPDFPPTRITMVQPRY